MPRIAPALVERYFQENYKRGAILRFYMECDDPNRAHRNKFGIVLNKNVAESEALLAITTTNLQAYAGGRFEDDILRIDGHTYECFGQDTIVSLREIRSEPIEKLKLLAQDGLFSFHGQVSSDDLAIIDQKTVASRLIERHFKKRII